MQALPVRILLAKVGLDGHDRGVKVLARAFRDAGMEVIYTGLWQTPATAAKAAVEEDVDILGASFHSAAHCTLVPIIKTELAAQGRGDMPVVIGGIIPPGDIDEMKAAGVAAVFEPEVSLEKIITECRRIGAEAQAARREMIGRDGTAWLKALASRDRAALGRVLSWIESGENGGLLAEALGGGARSGTPSPQPSPFKGEGVKIPSSQHSPLKGEGVSEVLPLKGADGEPLRVRAIGVTGAPGVGKSTLIGQLLREFRKRGKSVAAVAVDPVSPITGGALLGDRARMSMTAADESVFVRSSASRGTMGGLAPTTEMMLRAIDRTGIEIAIVETVGAGQNDVMIRHVARPVVLVMMPGAGDDLQLEKAGITEIADVFVINKSELEGADRLASQIRETIGRDVPIVKTIASRGEGIVELADVLLG